MKRRCCKICKWLAIITFRVHCFDTFWPYLNKTLRTCCLGKTAIPYSRLMHQTGHRPPLLGMMSQSHVPTEVCNRESDRRPAQFCKVAGFQDSGFQGSMVPRFQGCILPGTTPRPNDWSTTGSLLGISHVYLGNRIYIKFPNVETVWTIKTQSNCNIIRA